MRFIGRLWSLWDWTAHWGELSNGGMLRHAVSHRLVLFTTRLPFPPTGPHWKWRHRHSAHTVPYQQELISYWWNDYLQVFQVFQGVHIVMLNNLVGRPVVEMQTQVGLKLLSNTSTLLRRKTVWLHTCIVSFTAALTWKMARPRTSAGADVYFWGGYNSKKSRMRWHLEL